MKHIFQRVWKSLFHFQKIMENFKTFQHISATFFSASEIFKLINLVNEIAQSFRASFQRYILCIVPLTSIIIGEWINTIHIIDKHWIIGD